MSHFIMGHSSCRCCGCGTRRRVTALFVIQGECQCRGQESSDSVGLLGRELRGLEAMLVALERSDPRFQGSMGGYLAWPAAPGLRGPIHILCADRNGLLENQQGPWCRRSSEQGATGRAVARVLRRRRRYSGYAGPHPLCVVPTRWVPAVCGRGQGSER